MHGIIMYYKAGTGTFAAGFSTINTVIAFQALIVALDGNNSYFLI